MKARWIFLLCAAALAVMQDPPKSLFRFPDPESAPEDDRITGNKSTRRPGTVSPRVPPQDRGADDGTTEEPGDDPVPPAGSRESARDVEASNGAKCGARLPAGEALRQALTEQQNSADPGRTADEASTEDAQA
ncbi:hypothetical protein ACWC5I_04230 [Kitasatospora sp. NPDC001574]